MPKQDADYKRQVEEANQTLIDGLEAQHKVAGKGDDIEENSWQPFLNQLKGLVADGELLDQTRTAVEAFRDILLAHARMTKILGLGGRMTLYVTMGGYLAWF
ncbi:hypothetical protein F4677DRAFT_440228 [Hypoxylon crocopeplum]|nr:hypothetical protein F4677DRAFT_440228 [Hypoxylon crocopeplum]